MTSLNISCLYTTIPVRKCLSLLKTHLVKTNIKSLLPNHKIIKMCHLITNVFSVSIINFIDKNLVYRLVLLLASFWLVYFLEFLESGSFKNYLTIKLLF